MNAHVKPQAISNNGACFEPIPMDCSIAQLLKTLKAKGFRSTNHSKGFRQAFIDNPYLEQITLRQVFSSPLTMANLLRNCLMLPHCGPVTIDLLLEALENAAAGQGDQGAGCAEVQYYQHVVPGI